MLARALLSPLLLFVAIVSATSSPTSAASDTTNYASHQVPSCVAGVMVLAARGSDPAWNDSTKVDPSYADLKVQSIADHVVATVGQGSFIQALPYPATKNLYPVSVDYGVKVAQSIIREYVNGCDNGTARVVIMGSSQGAQVMSNMLVGGFGLPGLEPEYANCIVAGTLFADPSFVVGVEPLDAGNATVSGRMRKTGFEESELNRKFGTILRSYCQDVDYWCASGNGTDAHMIHEMEAMTWQDEAVEFLDSILRV